MSMEEARRIKRATTVAQSHTTTKTNRGMATSIDALNRAHFMKNFHTRLSLNRRALFERSWQSACQSDGGIFLGLSPVATGS